MNKAKKNYDLWRLVDARHFEDLGQSHQQIQLICDIDKTYLETHFDSWVEVAKIAFEDARDKRTVLGASDILLFARWGSASRPTLADSSYPRPLHFVSSSPPQLRKVLEEKLAMDGLDWSSDTFKNQAYNIRKRRFDLLKQQVAYKTAAILKLMARGGDGVSYYLLGDNAESDPFIYLGIKLLVEKKLSPPNFESYLNFAGVDQEVAHDLWAGLERVPSVNIKGIFIRDLPGTCYQAQLPLSEPVILFRSFFEVGLLFFLEALLDEGELWTLVRAFHNQYGLPLAELYVGLRWALEAKADASAQEQAALRQCLAELEGAEPLLAKQAQDLACSLKVPQLANWNDLDEAEILRLAALWRRTAEN